MVYENILFYPYETRWFGNRSFDRLSDAIFISTKKTGQYLWQFIVRYRDGVAGDFSFTAVAVSYGIMVLAAISKSSFLSRSKSYVTGQLAALSYAMYLSHKGIIHMTQTVLEYFNMETSDNICILLCLLLCIAGGIFFRFVIEKPSSKIKFKLLMLKKKD